MKKKKTIRNTPKTQEYRYDTLTYAVHPDVYKPAEDTFLMARILDNQMPTGRTLEIGTGCGLLSLIAAKLSSLVVATDINPNASANARLNARTNRLDARIETVRCDLASALASHIVFDHIIFNPPYLPVEETSREWIARSWAGGPTGIEFAEKAITETKKLLSSKGDFTLVVSGEKALQKMRDFVEREQMQLNVLDSASFFFERIYAIRVSQRS